MTAVQKMGRLGLLRILPLVVVPIAFLTSSPWLKTVSPIAVLVAAGVAAVFMVSYSNYLAFLCQRRQDEVQKASTGFSAQWGVAVGQTVFVVLLVLPPFLDFATSLVRAWAQDPGVSQKAVILAMTLGYCVLVLLQSVGTVLMRVVWWRTKR